MMRMIIITIIIRITINIIVTIRLLALMISIILMIRIICPLSRTHEGERLGKSGKGVRKGIRCC